MSSATKSRQRELRKTVKYPSRSSTILSTKKRHKNSTQPTKVRECLQKSQPDNNPTQTEVSNQQAPPDKDTSVASVEQQETAEAIRLILLETKRAKERAVTMGAAGWSQKQIPRVNKLFVKHTVSNALGVNNYKMKMKKKR